MYLDNCHLPRYPTKRHVAMIKQDKQYVAINVHIMSNSTNVKINVHIMSNSTNVKKPFYDSINFIPILN